MAEPVTVERRDHVLVITINRPEARNALDGAAARALAAAADELDADDALRVGVLTGAGGTFCAGMDLKAWMRGDRPMIAGRGFGGITMTPPRKPLIAAVEGYAMAGGSGCPRSSARWWRAAAAPCCCPSASRSRRRWSCC